MLRPVCSSRFCWPCSGDLADHDSDDAQLVGHAGDVRQQLADPQPDWPRCLNSQGFFEPFAAGSGRLRTLRRLPLDRLTVAVWPSSGLGSNVSTCDTPPSMNRKMTCLARGAKSVWARRNSAAALRAGQAGKGQPAETHARAARRKPRRVSGGT